MKFQLGKISRQQFISTFSGIYELSPWVAESAWEKLPSLVHPTPSEIHKLMAGIVNSTNLNTKRKLLCSHPELTGDQLNKRHMTSVSKKEQKNSGLDNCSNKQRETLKNLNIFYKKKFGFPFILAIKGYSVPEIILIFQKRIKQSKSIEYREAIEQVHKIALLRLNEIFDSGN